ncbi:MAG: VOC family protein [Gemmatimonadota bacterium]
MDSRSPPPTRWCSRAGSHSGADGSRPPPSPEAVTCESREAVDAMVGTAIVQGGRAAMPPQDHGFMYQWSFRDPDGHHWEPFWMDPAAVAPAEEDA